MPDERFDRILESLAEVNVNLESLRVTLTGVVIRADDHERRMRQLERWRDQLTPVLSVMTFLLGVIVTVAINRLM